MSYICYTDASFSSQSKIGFGGFLITKSEDPEYEVIKTRRFFDTTNTMIELEAIILLLDYLYNNGYTIKKLIIYTDCQHNIELISRRHKYEEDKKYNKFYQMFDMLKCDIKLKKIKGHKKKSLKNSNDLMFTKIDRLVRKKVREYNKIEKLIKKIYNIDINEIELS